MSFLLGIVVLYLLSSSRTELAVLASRPVVGSSKKRTEGSMMSSMPMLVLFLSPPEIPRIIWVPTWGGTQSHHMIALGHLSNAVWYHSLLWHDSPHMARHLQNDIGRHWWEGSNFTAYLQWVYKTLRTPALSMTQTDQVNPGESFDPLLMSLVKATWISVDEGEETG